MACSAAQETLRSLVASVCTRTVSVSSPGVARYLLEPYCSHFLGELEEELQVLIVVKQQPWEPLAEQVAPPQPQLSPRGPFSSSPSFCISCHLSG